MKTKQKAKTKHSITLGIPRAICWRGAKVKNPSPIFMENFFESPYKLNAYQVASDVTAKGNFSVESANSHLRRLRKARRTLKLFETAFVIMSFVVIFILPMYLIYLAVQNFGEWANFLYLILIVIFYSYYESMVVENEVYVNIKKWLDFKIEVYKIISEDLKKPKNRNKSDI